ncbi:BMC domain-containing protein [Cetobacterium sp. 8H]|uniref:BMC domain-containing protein n=1 Tax=Cetobacterium sp. 8H TaxID=2759681 RepID=UPI00163C1102|nr:BMC domain-containing protein [Cetobacterium sp. 8H]MBC2851699.1 BMC domain-containing protein [Cetobacterium sp. 8H]
MRKALGLVETRGMIGAIEAVDVACKTADVEVLNKHLVKGGIVTVELVGDVGAIKAAVDAAVEMTKKLGVYVSSHVIPRPDESIYTMIEKKNIKKANEIVEVIEEIEKVLEEKITEEKTKDKKIKK